MNFSFRHPVRSLIVAGLGLLLAASAARLTAVPQAPDSAETKIRLLSEALHARDVGDKDSARKYLQELLVLSPNDETVKRLLAGIDRTPEKKVIVTGGVVEPVATVAAPPSAAQESERIAREEEERLNRLLAAARASSNEARALAADRQFSEAIDRLDRARASLPENKLTQDVLAQLGITRAEIIVQRDRPAPTVAATAPAPSEPAQIPAVVVADEESANNEPEASAPAPAAPPARAAVANTPSARPDVSELNKQARFQYVAGEAGTAAQTLARALEQDPENAEAMDLLRRIGAASVDGNVDRTKTSAQLLNEVSRAWQRPGIYQEKIQDASSSAANSPLAERLNSIILPNVNFSGMELSRVVNTLSAISEEFDKTGVTPKGVNIVLLDQSGKNPTVNMTLRNLSVKRVLDMITEAIGYQYEIQLDAVVVRPGGEQSTLPTQFFPVSRSTVLRMTGKAAAGHSGSSSNSNDPLAGGGSGGGSGGSSSSEGEGQGIKNFLQLAGVSFETGSALAFDGSQLIVTQTPRNMERIRNILARYSDVRQVEIEAKFMEVQQGALEELGVQWNIGKKATQHSGATQTDFKTNNRSLANAFSSSDSGGAGSIVRTDSGGTTTTKTLDPDGKQVGNSTITSTTGSGVAPVPIINNPPPIPGTNLLGIAANPLAAVTGILGEFNVNAIVRALSQKSGTELLSAPKLTVLSGNQATITVAQELRYPQSYGQVQAQVGTGSASGGGSAGVAITAGTPQEFTTRNVGVELKVTPTVEEDDYSISLDLNPKVTEFEGFVEYGGQSIAISGGTTVNVPSGFFQPIFGVREMSTKVTIWDGATLIMGGLTREDVRKVNDKIPVLGNLPAIGRLFRSDGESSQKRNLLIFVTANLVSPGGSLKQQTVRDVPAGTMFQNPTIVTPTGTLPRAADGK